MPIFAASSTLAAEVVAPAITLFFNLSKKVLPKKNYNVLEVFKVFVDFELKEKQKKIACFHTPNNIYYLETVSYTHLTLPTILLV